MVVFSIKQKLVRASRVAIFLFLITAELIALHYLYRASGSQAVIGFLLKTGKGYLVVWKNDEGVFDKRGYIQLDDAVQFANRTLRLFLGKRTRFFGDVEYISMADRNQTFIINWKMMDSSLFNQMTFYNQEDAHYFEDAIRTGAYTPSPFGHSLVFIPKKKQK